MDKVEPVNLLMIGPAAFEIGVSIQLVVERAGKPVWRYLLIRCPARDRVIAFALGQDDPIVGRDPDFKA